MKETLEIGSSPCNEDCAQVGTDGYREQAQVECKQFIAAIRRVHGNEPEGARLFIKANAHDFGTYFEVAVRYDADNRKAEDYAYKVESAAPADWSDEDRKALGLEN